MSEAMGGAGSSGYPQSPDNLQLMLEVAFVPLAEVRASIDPTCIPVRVRGMPKSSRGGGKSDRP